MDTHIYITSALLFFFLPFFLHLLHLSWQAGWSRPSGLIHYAALAVALWGGSWTVPWPLVLRLLAAAELCSTGPASPA